MIIRSPILLKIVFIFAYARSEPVEETRTLSDILSHHVKEHSRFKRQFPSTRSKDSPKIKKVGLKGEDANCDFGNGDSTDLCEWKNINMSAFKFQDSRGSNSHWIGGPQRDNTEKNDKGGYAFFETSQLPNAEKALNTVSAMLKSPTIESTGAKGYCVSFSYFMEGLSADALRILLHPVSEKKTKEMTVITNGTKMPGEADKSIPPEYDEVIDFKKNKVLMTMKDDTKGLWKNAKILYSFPENHKLIFEAIPKDEMDQARRFRGYIALDDIAFQSGDKCSGHCTFDSGLCGFSNSGKADFDWKVGRGSSNPNTGPIRDHSSFSTNKITGAFAYIESGYPRRPGDKAHLISGSFPATSKNDPLCLKFWTHMYGSGVGELNVYAIIGEKWTKIWGLSGDAGNNWYMGQSPIASETTFKIAFEGVVGRNELGNIAIDDVTLTSGVCPTFPQVAGSGVGDCAFEDDSCRWKNVDQGDSTVDELNWERLEASSSDSRYPQFDHTTGSKGGYYMSLSRKGVQKAGDRAHLMSGEMKGRTRPLCMSFWYFMYEPIVDKFGPNLGKLSVIIKYYDKNDNLIMVPVWRLYNGVGPSWKYGQAQISSEMDFHVVIEGVWGNNRVSGFIAFDDVTFYDGKCDTLPKRASLVRAECTFDRDSCNWRNTSTGDFEWRLATLARRPANLPDKSFGAPVGYAYFDIFNTGSKSNKVKMISPTILREEVLSEKMCFSFWYAAFGAGDTTSLRVLHKMEDKKNKNEKDKEEKDEKEEDDEEDNMIWGITAADLNTARPEWRAGQVTVSAKKNFKLIFEGKASNGGFAIDHLIFNPGSCSIRPDSAKSPSKK